MAFRRVPTYELSEDAERVLQRVAQKSGADAGAVLSDAIALLELLFDAKAEGKKIMLTDQDEVPVQEVELESREFPRAGSTSIRPRRDPPRRGRPR